MNVMEEAYTGDGKPSMDKSKERNYRKDNQELCVVGMAAGEQLLRDAIKAFIAEKQCAKIVTAYDTECYNEKQNMIAAAKKEVCE